MLAVFMSRDVKCIILSRDHGYLDHSHKGPSVLEGRAVCYPAFVIFCV